MLDINVRSNTGRVLSDYSIEEPEAIERVVSEAALDEHQTIPGQSVDAAATYFAL